MKIADGFKLREICGEYVVVPEDARLVNFNKMLSLNGTAAFLWKSVCDKEFELDTLADLLVEEYEIDRKIALLTTSYTRAKKVEEYEIDRKIALSDARALLDKWIEIGVIVD